jgi:Lrp/AsnC family transcriptional regulator, leucine-responsive regulatory protein
LDHIDTQLLTALVGDARTSTSALAREVGLSGPSVHERLRKLEEAGVIQGYSARLNPAAIGRGTAAFIALNVGPGLSDKEHIERELSNNAAVLEVHEVAGEDCYLLKLRVDSPESLSEVLSQLRHVHPNASTRTTVVLKTVFERPVPPQ